MRVGLLLQLMEHNLIMQYVIGIATGQKSVCGSRARVNARSYDPHGIVENPIGVLMEH